MFYDAAQLLNMKNWHTVARYKSNWRKKTKHTMDRKQAEKPEEEE
jgi:hypothetical protein